MGLRFVDTSKRAAYGVVYCSLTLLECVNILSRSPLLLVHLNCLRLCPVEI